MVGLYLSHLLVFRGNDLAYFLKREGRFFSLLVHLVFLLFREIRVRGATADLTVASVELASLLLLLIALAFLLASHWTQIISLARVLFL